MADISEYVKVIDDHSREVAPIIRAMAAESRAARQAYEQAQADSIQGLRDDVHARLAPHRAALAAAVEKAQAALPQ